MLSRSDSLAFTNFDFGFHSSRFATEDNKNKSSTKKSSLNKDKLPSFGLKTNSSQELPLQDFIVYVEMKTNGVSISETAYDYLGKLGAKVEKRMNKKCNLVIWKDGSLKTIEKAKEYNATVVNSRWLEDCMENFHCAPFEKFLPVLPNDTDMPFMASQLKKKKPALKSLGSRTFENAFDDTASSSKLNPTQKKQKMNPDENRFSFSEWTSTEPKPFFESPSFENPISGSLFDRISVGSPFKKLMKQDTQEKPLLNFDVNKESKADGLDHMRSIISKYARSSSLNLLEEERSMAPTKENTKCTPEVKLRVEKEEPKDTFVPFESSHRSPSLSDDTISASEEILYEDRNLTPTRIEDKLNFNQVFFKCFESKYLEPIPSEARKNNKKEEIKPTGAPLGLFSRRGPENFSLSKGIEIEHGTLTPPKDKNLSLEEEENPFKMSSVNSSLNKTPETRCSTNEKNSFINKYLTKNLTSSSLNEAKEKNFSPASDYESLFDSAKKESNPFFTKTNERKEDLSFHRGSESLRSSYRGDQEERKWRSQINERKEDSFWSVSKIAQDVIRKYTKIEPNKTQ